MIWEIFFVILPFGFKRISSQLGKPVIRRAVFPVCCLLVVLTVSGKLQLAYFPGSLQLGAFGVMYVCVWSLLPPTSSTCVCLVWTLGPRKVSGWPIFHLGGICLDTSNK